MTQNQSKLTGVMLAVLIAGSVCTYANGGKQRDTLSDSSLNLLLENSWDSREVVANIKSCIAEDDIRLITATNIDVVMGKWGTPQVEFEGKVITMRLNKETGVYIAVSTQGKPSLFPETKKTKKREGLTEEDQCKFSILDKIEYCLASEGVRIIETTNVEALKAWIVAEMRDKNSISVNLDKETGMYTAVSKPKKEGE